MQIAITPGTCVLGGFNLLPILDDNALEFENKFSPCKVTTKDNLTVLSMKIASEEREVFALVPISFYIEYLFYLAMKEEKTLYYERKELATKFIKEQHFSSIAVSLMCVSPII